MPPDNLEPRVTALETQVHKLTERVRASEQDAAAARILAGAADRDVTEFRGELRDFRQATTASFNALREDLTVLRGYVNNRFDQVDSGFTEMRGKLDAAATGQQRIVELPNTSAPIKADPRVNRRRPTRGYALALRLRAAGFAGTPSVSARNLPV